MREATELEIWLSLVLSFLRTGGRSSHSESDSTTRRSLRDVDVIDLEVDTEEEEEDEEEEDEEEKDEEEELEEEEVDGESIVKSTSKSISATHGRNGTKISKHNWEQTLTMSLSPSTPRFSVVCTLSIPVLHTKQESGAVASETKWCLAGCFTHNERCTCGGMHGLGSCWRGCWRGRAAVPWCGAVTRASVASLQRHTQTEIRSG